MRQRVEVCFEREFAPMVQDTAWVAWGCRPTWCTRTVSSGQGHSRDAGCCRYAGNRQQRWHPKLPARGFPLVEGKRLWCRKLGALRGRFRATADPPSDDKDGAEESSSDKHEEDAQQPPPGERPLHQIPGTSLPLEELQKRIQQMKQTRASADSPEDAARDQTTRAGNSERSVFEVEATVVEGSQTPYDASKEVCVLVFRSSPRGDGIYSLRLGDEDIILAFERDVEAIRYARLLAAQEFPEPHVEKLQIGEVYAFCEQAGLRMGLVPSGMMVIPPEDNMPGYERYFRDAKDQGPPDREYVGELTERQLNELKNRLGRLVDGDSGPSSLD